MLHGRTLVAIGAAIVLLVTGTAEALVFAVIGDWGMGGRTTPWQTEMRSADELNEVCGRIGCNFTLSVGDNIYVGDVVRGLQDSFQDMFTSQGPFFPSIGNHDNVGPQIAYTQKNKRWKFYQPFYTRKMPIDDSGYTVQIFAVNTMDGSLWAGGQFTWLENELKNSDARWKMIFGHYPTTGSGRHKRVGTVGRIHQLMEKYGAQVYWCGHDHIVEVSNSNGRVLGMSGGMSRGGMMLRGIGGSARKYTLTNPSEFSKYPADWPGHGFITADLSPNVMTVSVWDQCGGMHYEFSITHDWIKKAGTMPAAAQSQWPSDEIVHQAFREELQLEKGPGGGIVYAPGGEETSLGSSAPTPEPTPAPPGSTPAPPVAVKEVTVPDLDKIKESTLPPEGVPAYIKYGVSTDCVPCNSAPTSGEPLTIYIDGAQVTSKSRLYLTNSVTGCELSSQPRLLDGTKIISPGGNVVVFTPTGVSTNVWVCYSVDAGRTFSRLVRIDHQFEQAHFELKPALSADGSSSGASDSSGASTASPAVAAAAVGPGSPSQPPVPAPSVPQAPAPAHSSGLIVVIGMLCGVIGAFLSVHVKQYLERRGHAPVPATEASS